MGEQRWSTAEVAAMAGVTSRALRHWDALGLVVPASTGPGGLRYYGPEELLRLQEVLVLRELGLRLEVVAGVLSGERDRVAADRVAREASELASSAAAAARPGGPRMPVAQEHVAPRTQVPFDVARYDDTRSSYDGRVARRQGLW